MISAVSNKEYVSPTLNSYDFSPRKTLYNDRWLLPIPALMIFSSAIYSAWKVIASFAALREQISKSTPIPLASKVSVVAFGLSGVFAAILCIGSVLYLKASHYKWEQDVKKLKSVMDQILSEIKENKEKIKNSLQDSKILLNSEEKLIKLNFEFKKSFKRLFNDPLESYGIYDHALIELDKEQKIAGQIHTNGKSNVAALKL